MAQSGRSRVDTTPKVAGRHDLLIKVMMLDGEERSFTVDRRAKAEVPINRVLQDLDIEEKEYFSLYYLDNNHRLFLDPTKQIKKLMPDATARQWDLYFGVKFYVHSPDILKQDVTRYLYVLQICIDIRENRILVDGDDVSNLAALLLQANVGDYNPAEHQAGYSLDFLKLLYSTTDHLPSRYELSLIELHKQHHGQNPEQAEMKFLNTCKDLRRYGQHLFAVYDNEGGVIHLGVSCTGIALHRSNKQIDQHVWPNIIKVSYRKRKFRIRYRRARENVEDVNPAILMELRCGEPPASKRLWKACVEQHSFFRLNQPELPPRRPSLLLRRGSKFRYSGGRTLEQMRHASYTTKNQAIQRTYSARFGKEADIKSRTNVHCYTISKSAQEDRWELDEAVGPNQYTMAVDKEVKRRQLAGNFNQQKVFALLKLEGAQTPMLSTQRKFVIKKSDISGKYELEASGAPPPSISTQELSSWRDSAPMMTLEAAPPSNSLPVMTSEPVEESIQVSESNHVESAPTMNFHEDEVTASYTKDPIVHSNSTTFQPLESPSSHQPAKESSVSRSYSENEDITPEIDKLDAMMSSITHEMEADSSLAASVVTAFLRREHALVEQNAGDYISILQEMS